MWCVCVVGVSDDSGDVVDVTVCYVDDGVVGVVVFDLVLVLLMVVDIWTV